MGNPEKWKIFPSNGGRAKETKDRKWSKMGPEELQRKGVILVSKWNPESKQWENIHTS
jgi:hypothetical protein